MNKQNMFALLQKHLRIIYCINGYLSFMLNVEQTCFRAVDKKSNKWFLNKIIELTVLGKKRGGDFGLIWVEKGKVGQVIIASNNLVFKQFFKILVRGNQCIQEGHFQSVCRVRYRSKGHINCKNHILIKRSLPRYF